MARTRAYYLALGYDNPYQWAHFDEVPFTVLKKPLTQCRIALVTTAAPYQPDKGPQGPRAPYNAGPKFYKVYSGDTAQDHDLRVAHVAIDRQHTHMEDPNCWFPLPAMRSLAQMGRFELAPRFHGVPTNRSQRHTLGVDVPELVARCQADKVDAVVLVPNCPICHQSNAALRQRFLERRERHLVKMCPLIGVVISQRQVISPGASHICDGFSLYVHPCILPPSRILCEVTRLTHIKRVIPIFMTQHSLQK